MKKQVLLAISVVLLLGIFYFSYHAFVVEKVEEDLQVVSVSTPLPSVGYFIEQIGGEHVKVNSLLNGEQDYHMLELTPMQIKTLTGSQAFFTLNTPEELPLVEKLKGSGVRVFDLSLGLTFLPFEEQGQSSGTQYAKKGNWDPHVWLGISNMAILAENVAGFLSELDPIHQQVFQENLVALQLRLQELWQEAKRVLAPYKDSCVVVLHASYGYFLQPFAIGQISLESFQRESSVKQLTNALTKAKDSGALFLFVSAKQNSKQADSVADQFELRKISFEPIFTDPFKEINAVLQAISAYKD